MRKKIMVSTLFVAFAVITGMNVYNAQKSDVELSGLALENVEALAQHWESGSSWRPGYEASSYMTYFPPVGGVPGGITTIPCCRYNGNMYNVCTAIDICPN